MLIVEMTGIPSNEVTRGGGVPVVFVAVRDKRHCSSERGEPRISVGRIPISSHFCNAWYANASFIVLFAAVPIFFTRRAEFLFISLKPARPLIQFVNAWNGLLFASY